MLGPDILVRSMSLPTISGKRGNSWQYHSRSDRHSKRACWGVLLDLLIESPLLRKHVAAGQIGFGINHTMRDFTSGRKKDLDLVLYRSSQEDLASATFASLVGKYDLVLTRQERDRLNSLPPLRQAKPASVVLALEAKAAMTSHIKAVPRLFDELNSSHLTIHGAADTAIAVGRVMVNTADTFISPDINKWDLSKIPAEYSRNPQPRASVRVIEKIEQLRRRSKTGQEGYDAIGITLVHGVNDGTPYTLATAPQSVESVCDLLSYEKMIRRMAALYAARFPQA